MKWTILLVLLSLAKLSYSQHSVVRPESEQPDVRKPLNINHLLRGHFYAASVYMEEHAGAGGWGGSGNIYHLIQPEERIGNGLGMIADTSEYTPFWDICAGFKLYLYNSGKDTAFFQAQDSRLDMVIEAMDKDGVWKPIEYLPNSWCGNSYHTLYLPPNYYWEFPVPVFEGKFRTQLRIKLVHVITFDEEKSVWMEIPKEVEAIYSNTWWASINPGQFTKEKEYTPRGLMDPYNE